MNEIPTTLTIEDDECYLLVKGIEEWILELIPMASKDGLLMQDADTKAIFDIKRVK